MRVQFSYFARIYYNLSWTVLIRSIHFLKLFRKSLPQLFYKQGKALMEKRVVYEYRYIKRKRKRKM